MLKPAQIAEVKARGFLINRGTENFSGRVVPKGSVFTAEDLRTLSDLAEKFGSGKVVFTSRLTAEIVGIPFDRIDAACDYAAARGLYFGGTGAKIRPITACKGTTCIYGNYDTQALAQTLHEKYYVGWANVKLPHKFKIGIGGCPNSCMKPSLNDFGIEAHRLPVYDLEKCRGCKKCLVAERCPMRAVKVVDGKARVDKALCNDCGICVEKCPFGVTPAVDEPVFAVFVGGTWGKHTRMGTRLSRYYKREELDALVEKTILWFRENAFVKERLGAAIDRVGVDAFEAAIATDDLLLHKDAILAAPLKERQA